MRLPLYCLMLGGLSIGMTEFMLMGLLPDVEHALHVSTSVAGYLISAYALGVVLGAPILVALVGNFPPKKVLFGLMLMFTACNLLSAIAPNYELLLVSRLLAGLPHGAFFGIGAIVASTLARPGRSAGAIAVMFSGLTLAVIIGVPLGTYIGHNFGWRVSFAVIAGVGGLTLWSIHHWLPVIPAIHGGRLVDSLKVFNRPRMWLIIGISAIGTGGIFAWISYVSKLMIEVAGLPPGWMFLVMMLAGLGMTLGNYLGGRLSDRYSPQVVVSCLLGLMVVTLLLVALTATCLPVALLMTFVTGAVAFAVVSPLQMLMINSASGARMLASCLIQSTSNMGNVLGSYLGARAIAYGYGYTSPQYVGMVLAGIGFIFSLWLLVHRHCDDADRVEEVG